MRPADAEVADGGPAQWTPAALRATTLAAATILIDGIDTQLLPLALPAIAHDWDVPRTAFAVILSVGTLGLTLGSMLVGRAADRFGRRLALVAAMLIVGSGGMLSAVAGSVTALAGARGITGLGMGAGIAVATTALAEWAPQGRRDRLVSFGALCMPVGGFVASIACAELLPRLGWRAMFAAGGALPFVLAVLLLALMSETPAFEALRGRARADRKRSSSPPVSTLLSPAYRRTTVSLWCGAFLLMSVIYLVIGWLPMLLASTGAGLALSSGGLAANGGGALVGTLACVAVVRRLGVGRVVVIGGGAATALFVCLAAMFLSRPQGGLVLALIAAVSVATGLGQGALYAIAASAYPPEFRGTGIGFVLGIGRAGAIASAFLGAWLLSGGAPYLFVACALLAAGSAVALRFGVAAIERMRRSPAS